MRLVLASLLGLWSLIGSGCINIAEKNPTYRFNTQQHVHAGMRRMSEYLVDLSVLSLDDSRSDEDKTDSVLIALDKIEATASDIGGEEVVTNYSVINRYMGAFLYDVQLSREFSNRQPPNHFPAYSLIKSCLSCHDSI